MGSALLAKRRAQHLGGVCAIGLVCVGIYFNTLNAPFVFDDLPNIKDNRAIRITQLDFDSLRVAGLQSRSRNRPVANVSFALNYYFGDYDVRGYRIVNVIIHFINGILVYALATILFRLACRIPDQAKPALGEASIPAASLLAALIFTAHPLQTQSVTYVVQRMNSLAVAFYLLALLLYLLGRSRQIAWKRWLLWAVGFASWVLALGSKQIAATLPLIVFLVEWFFHRDLSPAWLRRNVAYPVIAAVLLALVAYVYLRIPSFGYESRDFTMGGRILTQFRVVTFYVSLLLFPAPSRLNLVHEFTTSRTLIEPIATLTSLVFLAGLAALGVALGRRQRLLSFCILWFFVNLVIESSFIGLEMAFEHRLYLPVFGSSLAASYLLFGLLSDRRAAAVSIAALVVVALAGAAHVRNRVWRDPVTLWADVVTKSPGRARARSNFAIALFERGDVERAIEQFAEARRLDPDYRQVSDNVARAHNNIGTIRVKEGRFGEAIAHYREALRINPTLRATSNSLAWMLATCGDDRLRDPAESIRLSEAGARETNSRDPAILDTLAAGYAAAGRFEEAIRTAQQAMDLSAQLGQHARTAEIRKHLSLYRRNRPYVDPILNRRVRPGSSRSRGRNEP
jgi:tetratricopeptide (TPR) repeat protein